MGNTDYTITRDPYINVIANKNVSRYVFIISNDQNLKNYVASNALRIRPAFYLSSGVKYVSGSGTRANPYRIR